MITVALALAIGPAAPSVQADPTPQGIAGMSVIDYAVPSASLGQVNVLVATPPGAAPAGGWPVLYLLHGSSNSADGNRFIWQNKFHDLFTFAARDGVMLVMPEGGKAGYYSNWKSGPAWENFHIFELPAFLSSHLHADLSHQAIAGYSMGGFGALSYAARHPGMFKAVVALSPVADPLRNPSVVLNDVRAAGSWKYSLWGNPKTKSGKSTWKKHDPYYLAKGLRGTYLYLYAGKKGGSLENALRAQTLKLAKRLKSLGTKKLKIALSLHTSSHGTHNYGYWAPRMNAAWPGVATALHS